MFRDGQRYLFRASGMEAEGYEIHMGETSSVGGDIVKNVIKEQEKAVNHSLLKLREEQAGNHTEKQDGCCRDNLYGTYVHGIFDKAEVAETIVCALMKEKGMEPEVGGLSFDYEKYRERAVQPAGRRRCGSTWIWKQFTGFWKRECR